MEGKLYGCIDGRSAVEWFGCLGGSGLGHGGGRLYCGCGFFSFASASTTKEITISSRVGRTTALENCPFTGIYSAAAQAELSQQLPKKIEVIVGYEGRMVKKCLQNYF